jgi:hypothetical protein
MVDKTLKSLTALQGQSYVPDWLHDVMSYKRGMYNGVVTPTLEAESNNFDSYFYKDFKNAEHLAPANTPPRQKFNGYVNFNFNPELELQLNNVDFQNRLSSMVKTASMPSAEFVTDIKNQYNRKRITVSAVDFTPVEISLYDTVDSLWVIMLMKMYAHLFTNPTNMYSVNEGVETTRNGIKYDVVPEAVPSGDGEGTTGSFTRPFNSNQAGLNLQPGDKRNFITSIDIAQYHGQKVLKYTLFNPIITNFTVDGLDYSDSSPNMINLKVQYENFTIDPNVNAWISEDDLGRFSESNKANWRLLREDRKGEFPTGATTQYPPELQKERLAGFLNNASRTDQVNFLDSFGDGDAELTESEQASPDTQGRQAQGRTI